MLTEPENEHIEVRQCRHGLFMLNKYDTFVGASLRTYGEWCEREVSLLCSLLREGDVVLDAGANIGTHAIPFAKVVGPKGGVVAFEPQRHIFNMLAGNVALNGLRNVWLHPAAVGEVSTMILTPELPAFDESFNFSGVSLLKNAEDSTEPAFMRTIDSLPHDPRLRLIKLDVEGMESMALKGAEATIERDKSILYIENNTVERSAGILDRVMSAGYHVYWHIYPYYNPDNFLGSVGNIWPDYMPSANILCVRPEHRPIPELMRCHSVTDNWQMAWRRMNQ